MTLEQCNTVVEAHLDKLMSRMKDALNTLEQTATTLKNGGIDWHKALQRAKERTRARSAQQ